MNKNNDSLFTEFWHELENNMAAKEIRPADGPHPTPAQKIADMVEGMLLEEDIIPAMYCKFFELTVHPPRPDYGKKIKAAKKAGNLPQIEIRMADDLPGGSEVVN